MFLFFFQFDFVYFCYFCKLNKYSKKRKKTKIALTNNNWINLELNQIPKEERRKKNSNKRRKRRKIPVRFKTFLMKMTFVPHSIALSNIANAHEWVLSEI